MKPDILAKRSGKIPALFAGILLAAIAWLALAPPRIWLNLTRRVDLSNPVAAGQKLVSERGCLECHRLQGQGSLIAPELDTAAAYISEARLRLQLENPKKVKAWSDMPNPRLSDDEITAILAYLKSISQPASP